MNDQFVHAEACFMGHSVCVLTETARKQGTPLPKETSRRRSNIGVLKGQFAVGVTEESFAGSVGVARLDPQNQTLSRPTVLASQMLFDEKSNTHNAKLGDGIDVG